MSSKRATLFMVAATLAVTAPACADLERGAPADAAPEAPAPPPDTFDAAVDVSEAAAPVGDAPAKLSFAKDVEPVLVDRCQRCHSQNGEANQTSFILTNEASHDLSKVQPLVNAAAPAGSRLLLKATGTGHGGGMVLTAGSADYSTIIHWIQQGSLP